jgi:hypothetical protein
VTPDMRRFAGLTARVLLTLALLVALSAFSVWYHVLTHQYMATALMGSFAIHLASRPRRQELAAALVLSVAFAIAYSSIRDESLLSIYLTAFLGVGSLAVQGLAFLWGGPEESARQGRSLAMGAMFPLFLFFTGIGLAMVGELNPKTYDHFLYVFDQSLGFVPSFAVGQLLANMAPLRYASYYAYEFLPLAMSLAFVLDRNNASRYAPRLLSVFVTVGLWGYLAYHLYPAVGPIHVWPEQFPWHPMPPGTVTLEKSLVLPASRNAMPSLHLGMALVIWMFSRHWRIWYQVISATMLGLIALATLGFGEHYLIDLVVAVPFVVSAVAWCMPSVPLSSPARYLPAFGGAILTFAWLMVLRTGVPLFENRPFLAWAAILLTVALSLLSESCLAALGSNPAPRVQDSEFHDPDGQPYEFAGATG